MQLLAGTQSGEHDLQWGVVLFRESPGDIGDLDRLAHVEYQHFSVAPDRAGVYEAKRSSLREPFGTATKLTGRSTTYEYVSGISDDERTMFMAAEFATRVLVRDTSEAPYGDLGVTIPPSRLPGWRAIPIDGCRRLITTITPGGCESEQSVFFEAVGL